MRLARAAGGGVAYWIELPISELAHFMNELIEQLEQEQKAAEDSAKQGR